MIITALFSSEIELSEQEKDWLEEHRYSIRYAPNPDYPPICFMDKNGKPAGLNTDYIEIFEQKLGLKFQIVNCETWSDMLKKIKNKEIDMMGAIQNTEERREFLNFTDPYIVVPNKIITDDRQTEELNPENMVGKKIVIVEGYSIIDHIKQLYPDLNIIPVKDNPTGLEMVSFGTADVMITDIAVASYYMKKLGITNLKVSGNVDYDWVLTFACRQDWHIFSVILNKTLDCIPDGIPIIADAKRGDIGNTARCYARSIFEVWGVDAVTLNPYMGRDCLEPFLEYRDRGIYALCLTSNPGAEDFEIPNRLYLRVARSLAEHEASERIGLVVGATQPRRISSVRRAAPFLPFLLPGIGAQGGSAKQAVRGAWGEKPGSVLVNSSRSIRYASGGKDFAEAARNSANDLRITLQNCIPPTE